MSKYLRTPLVALLAAGSFVVVACGSAGGPEVLTVGASHGGTDTSGSGSSEGTGAGSTKSGSTSNGATGSSSGGSSSGTTSASGSGSSGTTTSSGSSSGSSSGGTTEPPAPVTPAYTVAIDNAAPSINLADTTVLNITVTPQSWTGPVTLSVANLPSDVTGAFDNATLNVTGTTPATAKLTLTSVSSSAPVVTAFNVTGTSGETSHAVPASLTVKSYITLYIPVNADSLSAVGATVNIKAPSDIANNPVTVNFVNLDSTPHEIHAENHSEGFEHGGGTFGQNQADTPVRKVTVAGSYEWHLHDDPTPGGPAGGTVVIQ